MPPRFTRKVSMMTSAPVLRIDPSIVAVAKAPITSVDLERLDRDRRALIRDCERLEARLGRLRRARRFGPNLAPYRTKLKTELADLRSQARGIAVKIKNERRRRAALLETGGVFQPTNVPEMVAALYKMILDWTDPSEWDGAEKSAMRAARDYVQTGKLS